MSTLSKVYGRVYVPAVAGRAAVPAVPARTVCTPKPAPGEWRYTCTRQELPDDWSAILIPPGGRLVIVYDPNGTIDPITGQVRVIDMYLEVCTSRWVTTGEPGPPVCVTYPAQPALPEIVAQPARVETVPLREWNAGADSVAIEDGDCVVTFVMQVVSGVVVGLEEVSVDPPLGIERAPFGLYFAGQQFQVIESGETRTVPRGFTPGDEFQILRFGSRILYRHNGQLVYESKNTSAEPLRVCSSLYASGDFIE